uniref:DNA-dependent protein kinase catalytic subunit n=1 Tax=Branchiostoma floridae TaxID=7739 RepID=C3YF64_BRAFL|eukprot:XP_002605056.1 hypothetical protein BRAFLDRAFT_85202 [Branchiostoma floridae]
MSSSRDALLQLLAEAKQLSGWFSSVLHSSLSQLFSSEVGLLADASPTRETLRCSTIHQPVLHGMRLLRRGRLVHFLRRWRQASVDPRTLQCVKGYKWEQIATRRSLQVSAHRSSSSDKRNSASWAAVSCSSGTLKSGEDISCTVMTTVQPSAPRQFFSSTPTGRHWSVEERSAHSRDGRTPPHLSLVFYKEMVSGHSLLLQLNSDGSTESSRRCKINVLLRVIFDLWQWYTDRDGLYQHSTPQMGICVTGCRLPALPVATTWTLDRHTFLSLQTTFPLLLRGWICSHPEQLQLPLKSSISSFLEVNYKKSFLTDSVSPFNKLLWFHGKPCKIFLSESDVKFMFSEMMQRSEQLYFGTSDSLEDKVHHLPSFLEALASIVQHLDQLSDMFVTSLERLVVVLFENFPRLGKKMHLICQKAILKVLLALVPKGATLRTFLGRIVYQALIRTCSHPNVIEGVTAEDDDLPVTTGEGGGEQPPQQPVKRFSYRDYLELWGNLLDSSRIKVRVTQVKVRVTPLKVRVTQQGNLLDSSRIKVRVTQVKVRVTQQGNLLDSSRIKVRVTHVKVRVTQQGNLLDSSRIKLTLDDLSSQDRATSDPISGLQAAKPRDFVVFINVVDFCRDLLPHHHPEYFQRWVYTVGHALILHSTRLPLVSGFYKLLSVCMTICTKVKYFKELDTKVLSPSEESMDTEGRDRSSEGQACFTLFRKFVREVLVRLKQYKDDLLASCLLLVLSLPHQIVQSEISSLVPALQIVQSEISSLVPALQTLLSNQIVQSEIIPLVPALQTTFRLGLSYLPLAHAGLDALERWLMNLPRSALEPHFPLILPYLDSYLRTGADAGSDISGDGFQTVSLTATSSTRGKRKIPIKLLKAAAEGNQAQESDLVKARLRIVRFLGSLGGHTNACLVTGLTAEDLAKRAVAWDTQTHLQFAVPFMDMKPTVCLDPFLPRICELATTSSDRQTKVAACELLHSLVLYMVGQGAQQPGETQAKNPMTRLYKKVFPVLMQLACDVEQVARQLFEPLMLQLIHWLTNNRKYESDETVALLDAIMDGLVHPTDTALRDFSSRCVREFLQWSIKQTSPKQLEKSPINIKSLLKRLYSLALHPNPFNRLGAALGFNSIYRDFREEESQVDMFTFELLVTFVESLALAHHDERLLGTQAQCVAVLIHLDRIVTTKADLLNKQSKVRRVPRGFDRERSPVLSDLVTWLLLECGRPQTECRHRCMLLVCSFLPLLPGKPSPGAWMKERLKEAGPDFFVTRFEGGGGKSGHKSGIRKYPTISTMDSTFTVRTAVSWFDLLLAALDSYCWAFGQRLLSPSDVLSGSGKKPSQLFTALEFFLSKLALSDIDAAARCFRSGGSAAALFTPRETEEYNYGKCTVIVRIMDFFTVLLGMFPQEACKTRQLLMLMCRSLPSQQGALLKAQVAEKLARRSSHDLFSHLPELSAGAAELDHVRLTLLVSGYQQLHAAGLLLPALGAQSGQSLAGELVSAVFRSMVTRKDGHPTASSLPPSFHRLAGGVLELACQLHPRGHNLLDCVMNKTPLMTGGGKKSSTVQGMVFFSTFKSCICHQLIQTCAESVPVLLEQLTAEPVWLIQTCAESAPVLLEQLAAEPVWVGSILHGLLDHLAKDKILRKKEGAVLCDTLLQSWPKLAPWWEAGALQDSKSTALTLLRKILIIDSQVSRDPTHPAFRPVFSMYLDMLTDSRSTLPFKSQVLDLLPFFTVLPQTQLAELKARLDRMVADNFPLKSAEFPPGSSKYNDYVGAVTKYAASAQRQTSPLPTAVAAGVCRSQDPTVREGVQVGADRHKTVWLLLSFHRLPHMSVVDETQQSTTHTCWRCKPKNQFCYSFTSTVYYLECDSLRVRVPSLPSWRSTTRRVFLTDSVSPFISCYGSMLLSALELSSSLTLLELLISVMCREARHVMEEDIQTSLSRFIKGMGADRQKPALDIPYGIFRREGSFPNEIRRSALERVCLPMLRLVHPAALTEFFTDHIREVMDIIGAPQTKAGEASLSTQLTNKLCCYQLLETMYSHLWCNHKSNSAPIFPTLRAGEASLSTQLTNKLCCYQLLETMYSHLLAGEASLSTQLTNKLCCYQLLETMYSHLLAGEASLCTQLTNKLCCYQLLETMYSRLPKEDVNTPPSRIVRAYKGQEVTVGNELTTAITKFGHAAKSEDLRGETGLLDLRREYHCAAYNALIAIISCTQTDMKFYTAFLFQENTAKGQFLLDNLVDTNKTYQFDAEFSAPVSRKKQFVSIRQEVRGQDSPEAGTSRYMQSYLAGSSLSEDISQFDFTSGTQVKRSQTFTGTQERHSQASQGSSGLQGRQKQDSSVNIHGDFLEMEMDELNQHECMSTMSAVLQHMARNNITPPVQHMARNNITPQVQKGAAPKDMPPWMSCLNKKLGGSSTHKNVKLFIAKLVVNNEEVFRPYARFWLSPLMELVVRGEASGEGINYFIVDLLVTMLSWAAVAVPEVIIGHHAFWAAVAVPEVGHHAFWAAVAVPEDSAMGRALSSRLLQFLMANTFHKNRAVMRNNLELIKTAVECWKGRMEVPTKVIHDQLCGTDPASKGNSVGIQLLGVVLANQLPPFNPTTSGNIDREQFFSAVAKNLQLTRYKDVYAAAAEVIGMIMKYMADVEKVTDGGFHMQVERYLLPLQVNQQDVFLTCVHKIHLHFPPFTDRDDGLQAIALQIVYALLQKLQVEELLYLLPAVAAFASHPAPECRRTMYDIMMWIYDNYREEASQQESAGRVLGTAKDCLLQGLSDEESYLRLLVQNFWSHETRLPTGTLERLVAMLECMHSPRMKHQLLVQNFWSHETRLPTGTLERLVAMLECMHSPRTEHQYLSYCTNLLLEMTSRSPDFSREVFQHPLSECRFQDVQIDHSWKQRHVAMTPMFVETQSSHPASSQSQVHSLSQGGQESLGGQLRATQDVLQFTATQATAAPKNAYNWLTQSSLDTFADYSVPLGTETQSSLLFTTEASKKAAKARRLKPAGPGFGSDRLSAGRDQTDGRAADDSQQSEILRLKRRFLKDQDVTRAYHARRQIRVQRMREERVKEQRAKRGNLVTLYRQYRVGDLPDIQIKYSYIIAPLQALAQVRTLLHHRSSTGTRTGTRTGKYRVGDLPDIADQILLHHRSSAGTRTGKYQVGDLPDIQIKYSYIIAPLQALAQALGTGKYRVGDLPDIQIKYSYIIAPLQALAQVSTLLGDLPDIQIKYSYIIAPLQALAQVSTLLHYSTFTGTRTGKYRVGDLPDIQIKYSYIIAPLQALAQEIENVKTEREAEELTEQISKFLNTALSNSEKYFPPFISSLQEICYREPRKLSPDASVIQQTGVVSLQQPIGIVLLEEQLVQKAGVEEPRSKRARTSSTPVSAETATWIELARLYKSLGDFDVLRGIFGRKVGTQTITYEALEAEARGDFKKAVELYNQAMQQTEWEDPQPLSVEEDLWDDSRLQCYDHLTQWKNLYEVSTVNIDDDSPPDLDKMWDDTYFQEHYLPFALRSKLKLLLEGEMDQSLLTFVDSAMQKPDRKALLESSYCEELAMLYLYQDDHGRAKYHLGTCTDSFLQEWSGMDRLMASSRAAKLQGLQKLTEMQEFLELISNDRNFETPWQVNRLLEKWSSRYPDDRMDPISVWDDIIANRCLYLDKLNDKFEQMAARGVVDTEGGGEPFSQRAQREQFLLRLVLVDSAREQTGAGGQRKGTGETELLNWSLLRLVLADSAREQTGASRQRTGTDWCMGTDKTKLLNCSLLRLVQSECAQEHANFPVALKHLKSTLKEFTEDDRLRLRWTHCYTRLHQRKASLLTGAEKLNNVLTTFEQLDKFSSCRVFEEDLSVAKQHHTLTSLSYEIVAHALLQEGGAILTGLKETRRAQLLTAAGVAQDTSVEQTISSLLQKGHACLQKAVKLASDEEKARHDASLDKSGIVDAFMAMVSFCDKILRHQEDGDEGTELTSIPGLPVAVVYNLLQALQVFTLQLTLITTVFQNPADEEGTEITSIPGLPVAVVTNLLLALRHDSPEARQRFPRLLQLVELYPDTMDVFIQKVSQVPSWLCISWLGQMVALLDKPEAVAVHGILTRIAQDYPQALVYPLKISSENFEFEDSVIGRRNQEAVNELKKTLSVIYSLVDKLIGGLEQLSHPDQLFKDWGDDADLKRLLKVDPKKRSKEDKVNIKRLYEEMYNSLLDFRSPSQDSSMSSLFGSQSSDLESQSVGFGPFRRRFAQQFAKECDKMFGKDGGRILDMKEKEFVKMKSGLQSMMGDFYRKAFPREKGNCYAPGLLKDYCPWLSDFNPLDYDRELEIPGQYTGKEKPLVQYHAKIAGFDQRVKVMGSLRKPKRITIRGDDERDRPFLVKGGEDLRQDQRIQQLFDIMNDILTLDPACSQRQLRIRTYGVIPMTSR